MFHTGRCSLAQRWMRSCIASTEITFLFRAGYNSGLPAAVTAAALSLLYHFTISAHMVQISPHGTSVQTPPRTRLCAAVCLVTTQHFCSLMLRRVGLTKQWSHTFSLACVLLLRPDPHRQGLSHETTERKKINSPAHPQASYPGMLLKCLGWYLAASKWKESQDTPQLTDWEERTDFSVKISSHWDAIANRPKTKPETYYVPKGPPSQCWKLL